MEEEQGFITIDQHAEHRETAAGIYLHWNGGRDSVEVFLHAAKHFKIRCDDYGCARLAQIIGNWFGGTLSLGAGCVSTLASARGDNGIYWIAKDWEIVDREEFDGEEQQPSDSTPTLAEVIAASEAIFNPPPKAGDPDHCYGCATMRHPCTDDDPSGIDSAALNKIIYNNERQKLRELYEDSGSLRNGERLRDIMSEDTILHLIKENVKRDHLQKCEDEIDAELAAGYLLKSDLDTVRSETFAEL